MTLRLRQVALVARALEPVLDDLQAVFGLEVAFRDPAVGQFGLENAVLPVGEQFLEVVAPVRDGTAAGRYLDRRGGDGGYMVITQTDDHPARRRRVESLGIRTVLDHEEPGHRIMQLHPADTGGSFLEIDWAEGRTWPPAGPQWEDAVRTDVVSGIRGVEIQASDPAHLADRWSTIVDLPLAPGPALLLGGSTVRFAPAADDRGDGLAAVELAATDPSAALEAASGRGLAGPDGVVTICGTRFVLS